MMENLLLSMAGETEPTPKQIEYDSPGTYSLVVSSDMIPMHAVVAGGGGGGGFIISSSYSQSCGSGGALAYRNNLPVKAGDTLLIEVGAAGEAGVNTEKPNGGGGGMSLIRLNGVMIIGASGGIGGVGAKSTGVSIGRGTPGEPVAISGAIGFPGGSSGGCTSTSKIRPGAGAAGGYSGKGGDGAEAGSSTANNVGRTNGTGGSGAGGFSRDLPEFNSAGGVGLHGEGLSGVSDGTGDPSRMHGSYKDGIKLYGGGGGVEKPGMTGGVRLIFGAGRAFPSTNTGDI